MKAVNTKGFSALEILAVLAIVSILGAVGFSNSRQMAPKYQTSKAAADFNQAVSLARQLAVTNNVEARILLVEFDTAAEDADQPNKGMYRLQLGNSSKDSTVWDTMPYEPGPQDQHMAEGTYDLSAGGQRHTPGISLQDWGLIDGPGTGNTDAIVFNPRGTLQNPMTDMDAEGGIAVTFINKKSLASNATDRTAVRVYSGGMVRTVPGGVQDAALVASGDTGGGDTISVGSEPSYGAPTNNYYAD